MSWLNTVLRTREVLAHIAHGLQSQTPASSLERDAVNTLCRLPGVQSVISGHHRSTSGGSLLIKKGDPHGAVAVLLNTIDGHENYERGSLLYGASLVVWKPHSHIYALVYDGMANRIREIAPLRKPIPHTVGTRQKRVVALGRYVCLNKQAAAIVGDASLRWFGSTTLAILAVADGHIDLAINRTKPWNLWWAAPLCMQGMVVIKGFTELSNLVNAEPETVASMTSSIDMVCLRPMLSHKAWPRLLATEYAKGASVSNKR